MKAVFTSLILLIAIALSAQTTTVTYAPAAGYDPKADSIQALKKAHKDTVAKYQGVLTLSDTVQHAYNIEKIMVLKIHAAGGNLWAGGSMILGGIAIGAVGSLFTLIPGNYNNGSHPQLSGGAIAGIVVGSIGGIITIGGFAEIAIGGKKLHDL